MTRQKKRETPAAVPRARIEDATVEATDELGTLVRIDYIDGSYRLERIPLLTRPAPKRPRTPSALRTTGDGRVLVVSGTMAGAEALAALMPGETGRVVELASIDDDAAARAEATKAADAAALDAALVRWMMRGGAP